MTVDDDEQFVHDLVDLVPALRPDLERHRHYYDEVLSHVFFGDLSRWAVAMAADMPLAPELATFLNVLEEGRRTGGQDLCDLIDQSFIENICGEHELAVLLPPLLTERYAEICGSG